MIEHESGGPTHATGHAPPRTHAPEPVRRAASDLAADAIVQGTREVGAVGSGLDAVRLASAANDPAGWQVAREQVTRQLAGAQRALELARRRVAEASPESRAQLDAAERMLAEHEVQLAGMTEAPRGWRPVAREAELLAILRGTVAGSARAGFEHKEAALKAELAQLSVDDSRALAERLRKARPDDPIAAEIARLVPARRTRVLTFLDGARKREALAGVGRTSSTARPGDAAPATPAGDPRTLAAQQPAPALGVAPRTPGTATAAADRAVSATQPAPAAAVAKATPTKPDVAWAYLRAHEDKFLGAIAKRLGAVPLPASARVSWIPHGLTAQFGDALTATLNETPLFLALPELLYPADPWYLIDAHRPLTEGAPGVVVDGREATGPLTWSQLAGDALAIEVGKRVRESVARMLPRYVVQLDAKAPAPVTVADLVTSHPIDRVIARLLCDERVAKPTAAARRAPGQQPADPQLFAEGVRFLQDYRWLGADDRSLWNWIEVKEPRDATAEDVAATLWLDPAATHRAYGITAAPPFFRIDPGWARKFDDAKAFAPAGVDGAYEDHALALAAGERATDVAIAQAADERRFDRRGVPLPPDLTNLKAVLDRSHRQLERVRDALVTAKLWELVLPALQWVAKHREHLLAIPEHRLIALTPVIEGQQEILFEAAGAITEVLARAGAAVAADGPNGAATRVLRRYAIAMGESHLLQPARAELARARQAKGELALDLLTQAARDTQLAIVDQRGQEAQMSWGGEDAAKRIGAEQRQIVDLRAKQASGEAIDADEVELFAAEIQERGFEAKAKAWYLNLYNLREEARASMFGAYPAFASLFSGNVRGLPKQLSAILDDLQATVIDQHGQIRLDNQRHFASRDAKGRAWVLRETVRRGELNLAAFIGRHEIAESLSGWIDSIDRQRTRTAVIRIAANISLLIGTSIVGGMVGNVVAGAVRGTLLADAAGASVGMMWGVRIANATGRLAGLATDAAINASVQVATSDKSAGDAFLDNFLASGAVRVALAPLHRVAAAYGTAGQEVANLSMWERSVARGKTVMRAGATLTAEMITGASVDYVVHRMRHGEKPDATTAMDWAIQGGSMAIGAFVGRWLHGFEARVVQLAEHGGHLRQRARRMRDLARQVENTGDKDVAMETLVARHDALAEEARTIAALLAKGKLDATTASTLERGNRSEQQDVHDAAFSTMPLRLAGLTPDDASGTVWAGSTEDITIALAQAHRAGITVVVEHHDAAARQWKVRYNGKELTIIETALVGRPRPTKQQLDDADRRHAVRYAQAAAVVQDRWEATQKTRIDARPVIEFDHLQLGYAFGGAVNQATLPVSGDALGAKVVVYDHKGTLSGRGAQQLGQDPSKFDAPGVRASEQAPEGAEWITSAQLNRALDIGRLETQTPAYRGTAVALEARPKGALPTTANDPNGWAAPGRAFRVKIRDPHGAERWFYVDRFDNLGGLGPGKLDAAQAVAGAHLDPMLRAGQLLRADDPDYAAKVRAGRVLVWGGSPTGAWAAEPAVHRRGTEVTVLGDTQPGSDWPTLLREYEDVTHELATHVAGDVPSSAVARKAQLERLIATAHSGMTLRRNQKPGATYHQPPTAPRGKDDVQIDFGTPSKLEPTPDGRVLVTIGSGEHARSSIYDQVVVAHGQDPGAAGAPGGLLGKGARGDEQVPAGTIALRPLYGPKHDGREPELLGLESVDPPGIQLKGAAYASKRMAPWIVQSERKRFVDAIDAMAGDSATTRDYGHVSDDSRTVSAGVEVQRDRIPRANEVLGAKAYRLPGPEHTLELDPANRAAWDEQVREFFTLNLRANGKWVRVQRLGGGKSGAVLYRVSVDANDVGVFKLFDRKGAADEQRMLQLLAAAKLKHMQPVRERGQIAINAQTGFDSALLMDTARGTSVKELIESLPRDPAQRDEALEELRFATQRVARGLAEMHSKFEGEGLMTIDSKQHDAIYFLDKSFRGGADTSKVRAALGEMDFDRVRARLEGPILDAFLAANVPATAYHGDANAGNFIVDQYTEGRGHKDLSVIDVGSMQHSVSEQRGTKTGAADVARFLGSFETLAPGALTPSELAKLRNAFTKAYFGEYRGRRPLARDSYGKAEAWYRIEMQVAVLKSDPSAKQRLLELVGLEASP